MATVNQIEIAYYHVGKEMVCPECVKADEYQTHRYEDVVTKHDIETLADEVLIYCDRCGKRME